MSLVTRKIMLSRTKSEKLKEKEFGMKNIEMTRNLKKEHTRIRMVIGRQCMLNMVGSVLTAELLRTYRFITGITVGTMFRKLTETMTFLTSFCCAEHAMDGCMEKLMGGQESGIAAESVEQLLGPIRPMDYAETVRQRIGTRNTERQKYIGNKDIVQAGMKVSGLLVDEVWATDLPSLKEREEIFKIHLRKRNRDPKKFGCAALAVQSENMTGAEIEACIEDAMFTAFDNGAEVTAQNVLRSIRETIPQAVRDDVEIKAIREWVANKARLVSGTQKAKAGSNVRRIKTVKKEGS